MFGMYCWFLQPSPTNCFRSNKFYRPSLPKTFDQDRRILPSIRKRIKDEDTRSVIVFCLCLVFLWVLVWRPRPKESRLPVALFGAERFYVVWFSPHHCFVVKIIWFGLVNEDFMQSPNSFLRLVWFSFRCHRPFSLGYRTHRFASALQYWIFRVHSVSRASQQ